MSSFQNICTSTNCSSFYITYFSVMFRKKLSRVNKNFKELVLFCKNFHSYWIIQILEHLNRRASELPSVTILFWILAVARDTKNLNRFSFEIDILTYFLATHIPLIVNHHTDHNYTDHKYI